MAAWDRTTTPMRVAYTAIGDVDVSTVFLGDDLWETMVFGQETFCEDSGYEDEYQRRYSSELEALKGHEEEVIRVVEGR